MRFQLHRLRRCAVWLLVSSALAAVVTFKPAAAQVSAPCGIVDSLDIPVSSLRPGYDDFGVFRERFGGFHTGLDIAFDRWGDPVVAAARGRVTYANPEGWDTEKGVVVLSHILADGSLLYTVYGHMEETDEVRFPLLGSCVERGQIIGTVGWPSRGRPHLHYEIRRMLPNDGGPGYITDNPLGAGWLNPLDYTAAWRLRQEPALRALVSFSEPMTLPPVQLESGGYVTANGPIVSAWATDGQPLWRISADGDVVGLAALAGDRVVAHTTSGQALTLDNGRFAAVWVVENAAGRFAALGERLIFALSDGSLVGYDTGGMPLWRRVVPEGASTAFLRSDGSSAIWVAEEPGAVFWRRLNGEGQIITEAPLPGALGALGRSPAGWFFVSGNQILSAQDGAPSVIDALPANVRVAAISGDAAGPLLLLGGASPRLLALDRQGAQRWEAAYPATFEDDPPLLAGGACQVYTLDADGTLRRFAAADGSAGTTVELYAGGRRTRQPGARLLQVDAAEQVYAASGYLSLAVLDGHQLAGEFCS